MSFPMGSILPPEVLGVIFLESRPKKPSRNRIPHELVMSHVCRYWREAALGFAELWSNIEIYSEHSLIWLPTYLERSKSSLLDIHLDTYELDKQSFLANTLKHIDLLKPVFVLLISHIERVRQFFWHTCMVTTVHELSPLFDDLSAPALQRFRIIAEKHTNPRHVSTKPPRIVFNGGAPKLDLVDVMVVSALPRLDNVTTLMLGTIGLVPHALLAELLKLASDAPNLTHLRIDRITHHSTPPDGMPNALVFKSLRSLKLVAEPSPLIAHFLHVLQAPQLESLWLGCRPFNRLVSSFSGGNRFPSLRYLTLQGYDFAIPQVLADVFPTVTHLHLPYPANAVMRINTLFSPSVHDRPWWPNVHTLVIQTSHDAYNMEVSSSNSLIFQLRHLLPFRKKMNLEIKTLLLDNDLFQIAAACNWGDDKFVMEKASTNNYDEYWWNLQEDSTLHIT